MTDLETFDPRVTPVRRDLAAASLRGQVDRPRYAEGASFTVMTEVVDLKRQPRPDAPLDTQLLYGETLVVYDDEDGWGWAQADRDGYVGYVAMSALGVGAVPATHRSIVNRTFVYPAADMKQPPFAVVPREGRLLVEGERGRFLKVRGCGFVHAAHLAPLDVVARDFVAVAEQLIGTPYLWGGRSPQGIDCSGLVQLATAAAGRDMPRDTDMQARIGSPVPSDSGLKGLRRGDLVFWKGHVGIMCDETMLLHANAHHMLVQREALVMARDRASETGAEITAIRRILG